MEKIKVVVIDDVDDIRKYIRNALQQEADIEVVGEASSGHQAIEKVRLLKPDVILVDILMETPTAGLDVAEVVQQELPDTRIIILTINEDANLMFQAYCFGAMDYILKTTPTLEIAQAVRNTYNNNMMIRPNVATELVREFTQMRNHNESLLFVFNIISKLSNSEFDILTLVYEGYKYREIAEIRFVSMATIKSQVNSMLRKFKKRNMKEVIELLKPMNFSSIIKEIQKEDK